jgi:hypothetical protein
VPPIRRRFGRGAGSCGRLGRARAAPAELFFRGVGVDGGERPGTGRERRGVGLEGRLPGPVTVGRGGGVHGGRIGLDSIGEPRDVFGGRRGAVEPF